MILFDVVLGEGSHPDPASELIPVIQELRAQRSNLEFIAIVIGTDEDPQNLQSQVEQLQSAGVSVHRSVAKAVEYINLQSHPGRKYQFPPVLLEQLNQPLAAINIGLESFYDSLVSQGAQAVHVEWRPPAGGNERLAALLQKMKNKKGN